MRERVVNSTRGTLEEVSLQGLLPGTMYTIRVIAHNEHGPGQSSRALDITTQSEVAVPGPPSVIAARATSSFSILISWRPPGEEVQRYKLYYRRVSHTPTTSHCQNNQPHNAQFAMVKSNLVSDSEPYWREEFKREKQELCHT